MLASLFVVAALSAAPEAKPNPEAKPKAEAAELHAIVFEEACAQFG